MSVPEEADIRSIKLKAAEATGSPMCSTSLGLLALRSEREIEILSQL